MKRLGPIALIVAAVIATTGMISRTVDSHVSQRRIDELDQRWQELEMLAKVGRAPISRVRADLARRFLSGLEEEDGASIVDEFIDDLLTGPVESPASAEDALLPAVQLSLLALDRDLGDPEILRAILELSGEIRRHTHLGDLQQTGALLARRTLERAQELSMELPLDAASGAPTREEFLHHLAFSCVGLLQTTADVTSNHELMRVAMQERALAAWDLVRSSGGDPRALRDMEIEKASRPRLYFEAAVLPRHMLRTLIDQTAIAGLQAEARVWADALAAFEAAANRPPEPASR